MINRKQFGRMYAERFHTTYIEGDAVSRQAFELLASLLYDNEEDVVIANFGSFRHKETKAKNVRHPATGEMTVVPARDVIKFTPSETYTQTKKKDREQL